MASSYQPVLPLGYFDDQLPDLFSHQSYDFGTDFSFLDLETTDSATFFEYSGFSSQPVTFAETSHQSQCPSKDLLPEIDVVKQLSNFNLLNNQLQQRVDELDAVYGELQDKNVPESPQ
jgi:hypothetical protein